MIKVRTIEAPSTLSFGLILTTVLLPCEDQQLSPFLQSAEPWNPMRSARRTAEVTWSVLNRWVILKGFFADPPVPCIIYLVALCFKSASLLHAARSSGPSAGCLPPLFFVPSLVYLSRYLKPPTFVKLLQITTLHQMINK